MNPLLTNPVISLPPFPLWLYKYLAAFPITGLLGLDHFALGSQFTGLAKLFINLFTLGSWYAFDIVQVYNTANLNEKGLEIPFFEFGSIGKGNISDEPMTVMSKNTNTWLYILYACLFGGVYWITTFFLSSSKDAIPTLIRFISKFSFYIMLIICGYTLFYMLMGKSNLFEPSSFNPGMTTSASRSLSTSSLFSLGSVLPTTGVFKGINPTMQMFGGGDSMKELRNIIKNIPNENVIEGGSSNSHIYFALSLALLPISGFIIYKLRNRKNESNKSE